MAELKIIIADDHAVVRRGLLQLLKNLYPSAQITECGNVRQLPQRMEEAVPDLVIAEILMPGAQGLDIIEQVIRQHPKVPVLVLSALPEEEYAMHVLKAGAYGYITKDASIEELTNAIQLVLQEKKYISVFMAEKLMEDLYKHVDISRKPHERLTERELEIFLLIAQGNSLNAIGKTIGVGATTVSTYRARILEKMNLHSNAACTKYAVEQQLI